MWQVLAFGTVAHWFSETLAAYAICGRRARLSGPAAAHVPHCRFCVRRLAGADAGGGEEGGRDG